MLAITYTQTKIKVPEWGTPKKPTKKPTLFSFAIYFTGCVIGVGGVNSSAVGEKQTHFGDAVM